MEAVAHRELMEVAALREQMVQVVHRVRMVVAELLAHRERMVLLELREQMAQAVQVERMAQMEQVVQAA